MYIWQYLEAGKLDSIAVIGIAKNVGKTVFLNQLIKEGKERLLTLGLMSMGRDGEGQDSIFGLSKPPINVYSGSYLVSAARCLEKSSARFKVVENLHIPTPLGETYLAAVVEDGQVELVGPRSREEIVRARQALRPYTDLVLIDGALDRKSSAAPELTDGTFLVIGASAAPSLRAVKEKAASVINCFRLPALPQGEIRSLAGQLIKAGNSGLIIREGGGLKARALAVESGYQLAGLLDDIWSEEVLAIVVAGAFTDSLAARLQNKRSFRAKGKIIVNDPTRIFLSRITYKKLQADGPSIYLHHPIKLLGLVTNSYSPEGKSFEPGLLAREIKDLAPELPVFDLAANIHLPPVGRR
ncbi:MAG: hypothetical protein UMV23_04495 [Halanaerobium sp.]|nr:hypothetical protein [Halanaerobium sp.]